MSACQGVGGGGGEADWEGRGVGVGGGVVFSPTEERETNKEMKSPQA